jgi:drug/metabolite transporter (DMT)-like permease
LALFTVSVIYGINFIIAKEVMPAYILPFGFILLRVSTATLFFFLFAKAIVNEKIEKQDWQRLFWCSIFGVVLNQLLFFKGLNQTTPINASLIMITTPISVLVLARLMIGEAITLRKAIGIFLGAAGALLILFGKKDFVLNASGFWGDMMVLFNAFFYAVYLVLVKPLMKKYNPLTVIKWVFAFGLMPVSIAGYYELSVVKWHTFSNTIWLYVGFVLIGTTIMAYLLNIYAMKKLSPTVVGIYIYVQPVVATAMSLSMGKDHLNILKIVAAIMIFSGVYLASMAKSK